MRFHSLHDSFFIQTLLQNSKSFIYGFSCSNLNAWHLHYPWFTTVFVSVYCLTIQGGDEESKLSNYYNDGAIKVQCRVVSAYLDLKIMDGQGRLLHFIPPR